MEHLQHIMQGMGWTISLNPEREESCCRGSSSAKFPWRTEFVLFSLVRGETWKHAYANFHFSLSLSLSLSLIFGGGQKLLHSVSSCGRFLFCSFSFLLGCDVLLGKYFVSGRDLLTDRYWWCHSSVGLPSVITRHITQGQLFPRVESSNDISHRGPFLISPLSLQQGDWRIIIGMKLSKLQSLLCAPAVCIVHDYHYERVSMKIGLKKGPPWINRRSCTCTNWCRHWFRYRIPSPLWKM